MATIPAPPPTFRAIFNMLAATTTAGDWWPAVDRFEILVGAVLTQNTAWTNVERAIANLFTNGALSAQWIDTVPETAIQPLIKPAGYWRAKSTYLKHIARWYLTFDPIAHTISDEGLRQSLLSVHGVGDETADDILLYAYARPVFIYDLYARRLLEAVGYGEFKTYRHAKRALDPLVMAEGFTTQELADFHGLIVQAGKDARAAGGWATHWATLTAIKADQSSKSPLSSPPSLPSRS